MRKVETMKGDARDIPDSWKQKDVFDFEVSWLTDSVPENGNHIWTSLSCSTDKHFIERKIKEPKTKEIVSELVEIIENKYWSNLGSAKYFRENDFQKFYFEVSQSLLFDDYFELKNHYFIAYSNIKSISQDINRTLRSLILNDVKHSFLDIKSRKGFDKTYKIDKFAIRISLNTHYFVSKAKRRFCENDNPLFSISNRYCFVEFVKTSVRLGIQKNYEYVSEGRLKIEGNSLICGNWKYDFENETYIYGYPFVEVDFYTSEPIGMFHIWVNEEETGEFYERSEHHE